MNSRMTPTLANRKRVSSSASAARARATWAAAVGASARPRRRSPARPPGRSPRCLDDAISPRSATTVRGDVRGTISAASIVAGLRAASAGGAIGQRRDLDVASARRRSRRPDRRLSAGRRLADDADLQARRAPPPSSAGSTNPTPRSTIVTTSERRKPRLRPRSMISRRATSQIARGGSSPASVGCGLRVDRLHEQLGQARRLVAEPADLARRPAPRRAAPSGRPSSSTSSRTRSPRRSTTSTSAGAVEPARRRRRRPRPRGGAGRTRALQLVDRARRRRPGRG